MKTCEPAIFELLKALAGGNVFGGRAKKNQESPFIIYQRADSVRWRSLNGPSGLAQAYIQIDSYEKDYNAARALAAQVETVLDGYRGIVYYGSGSPQDFVRIGAISAQSDVDLLDQTDEPLLHRVSATFLVTYEQ